MTQSASFLCRWDFWAPTKLKLKLKDVIASSAHHCDGDEITDPDPELGYCSSLGR